MMDKNINYLKKLSIIIVNYNCCYYLNKCLESIYKYSSYSLNKNEYQILVVDNASEDDSVNILKSNFPEVKVMVNDRNLGFSAANNIGIKNSFSEYILLINSDCEVYKDSIAGLISFMDNNREVGITGPKILNSDGSVQLSCRRFPSFFDATMHSIIGSFKPDNPFSRRYKLADVSREKPSSVDWVSGSCMMVRRTALKDTGLMDEKYFMYVEDTDICFQMWKHSWKVYYYPLSSVLHHWGKSTEKAGINSNVLMQKSAAYFFWKNYKNSWKILFYPLILFVLGLRILLTFIKNLLK